MKVVTGRNQSPLYPFSEEVLPGGLTVVAKRTTATPIAAVYLWAKVGAASEPPETAGISHFLEHMFFKGTELRGVGEMDRAIKAMGGYNNAFTGFEYTAYYAVVPAEHFVAAFDLLYDAAVHSRFDPEEIERERQVIKEEIHRSEDNPSSKLSKEFLRTIFPDLPYGRPILGNEASLCRIGREDLLTYRRDFYSPRNIVAVVVGDVEENQVAETIGRVTRDWKDQAKIKPLRPDLSNGGNSSSVRERVVEKDVNLGYWVLGYPTQGRSRIEDVYALEVASTILGSGKSSRLHRRVVEEMKIASSVGSWVLSFESVGTLGIEAEFDPANRDEVETVVVEEVERMGCEPATSEEIEKARRMLISDFAYANETNSNVAATLGRYYAIALVDEAINYTDRIKSVSAEDVLAAMAKYGKSEVCSTTYLKPKTLDGNGK